MNNYNMGQGRPQKPYGKAERIIGKTVDQLIRWGITQRKSCEITAIVAKNVMNRRKADDPESSSLGWKSIERIYDAYLTEEQQKTLLTGLLIGYMPKRYELSKKSLEDNAPPNIRLARYQLAERLMSYMFNENNTERCIFRDALEKTYLKYDDIHAKNFRYIAPYIFTVIDKSNLKFTPQSGGRGNNKLKSRIKINKQWLQLLRKIK